MADKVGDQLPLREYISFAEELVHREFAWARVQFSLQACLCYFALLKSLLTIPRYCSRPRIPPLNRGTTHLSRPGAEDARIQSQSVCCPPRGAQGHPRRCVEPLSILLLQVSAPYFSLALQEWIAIRPTLPSANPRPHHSTPKSSASSFRAGVPSFSITSMLR